MSRIGYFFALCLLALLVRSCTPVSVADNKRILVQGRIVGENGEPLENIKIRTTTNVWRFLNSGLETISEGATNENGEISFVSLDVDSGKICLEISGNSNSPQYQSFIICDPAYSRKNTKFDLGDFKLKKVADIMIIASVQQDLGFSLKYQNANSTLEIDNWDLLTEYDMLTLEDNYSELFGTLEAQYGKDTIYLRTLQNSNISLQLGYPEGEQIYDLEINAEDTVYEIEL